jgi:Zn-dependent alcohol dehydrogenase
LPAREVLVRTAATAVADLGFTPVNIRANIRWCSARSTGTIEAVGDGVAGLPAGHHQPDHFCGHCDSCRRAQHLCRNAGLFGREVDGSERLSACRSAAHALPATMPLAD